MMLFLTAGTVAHAGSADVAASLPNEAAECRYLLDICRRAADATDPTKSLSLMAEAGEVARTVRAKHEAMPSCFRKCQRADGRPLLALERFE